MTYNYRLSYDDLTRKLINLLLEIKIDIKKGKQVDKITTKIINPTNTIKSIYIFYLLF